MLRILIVTACILIGASSLHSADNKPVAAMHKPVGTVDCNTDGSWKKAVPAMPLFSGNIVRTQENSFAIIKFLESSILRVQEKSEVEIRGTKSADKEFSKNVYVRTGTVGFNVKHRPNEKFEFSTPTSVASIRGTEGALIAESDSSDLLVLSSGMVVFTNVFSHRFVTVGGGQTGHSLANGDITVRQSQPADVNKMRRVQQLGGNDSTGTNGSRGAGSDTTGRSGSRGAGRDTTGTSGSRGGGNDTSQPQSEELRIKLTDPNGNQKIMIIKYE